LPGVPLRLAWVLHIRNKLFGMVFAIAGIMPEFSPFSLAISHSYKAMIWVQYLVFLAFLGTITCTFKKASIIKYLSVNGTIVA